MSKFWVVFSHTYATKFMTKSFLITNIAALLLIFALANIQTIRGWFSDDGPEKVAVLDETENVYDQLVISLAGSEAEIDIAAFQGTAAEAKAAVMEEEYDGFLHITEEENSLPAAAYFSNQIATTTISSTLEQHLQQIKTGLAAAEAGLRQEQVQEILSPLAFESTALEDSAKTEEELSEARGLVYVMLFLLYFAVITYGNMIAMDVANEKTSRVMEILISSTPPVSQMFAKILGIALLGLTQVGLFIGVGYIMIRRNQDQLTGGMFDYFGLQSVNLSTFLYALVFFLLGYLLYATLSAMLGSIVSRVEDVQQLMLPVIFLIMIAFLIAMFGLNAPASATVTITSFIPFFAPMLMFLRVGMLEVPAWEVAASISLLVLTIGLFAVVGGRIYRGGVLMYGSGTSLKDVKKALQLSKKE